MAQQVKDLVLSLLWRGLNPWAGSFHRSGVEQTKRGGGNKRKVIYNLIMDILVGTCSGLLTLGIFYPYS